MEYVKTDRAPLPIACYSQAVKAGGFLFISGQAPLDPKTKEMVKGGVGAQTKQVLENIKAIAEAANSSLSNVVKMTIFLKKIEDFKQMNDVYCTYFVNNPPARTTVQAQLPMPEMLIEIEAIVSLTQ
jgi:2-iminobutanoate/2-iminopropanoate deaminase